MEKEESQLSEGIMTKKSLSSKEEHLVLMPHKTCRLPLMTKIINFSKKCQPMNPSVSNHCASSTRSQLATGSKGNESVKLYLWMCTVTSCASPDGERMWPEAVVNYMERGLEIGIPDFLTINGFKKFITEPQSIKIVMVGPLMDPWRCITSPILE